MTRSLRLARILDGTTECRDASRIFTWLTRRPDSPRSHIAAALHLSAETARRTLSVLLDARLVEVAEGGRVQMWRVRG